MSCINYFKLDFRLMKESLKTFILIPLAFLFVFAKSSPTMALGYLFFFLIIFATTPFSIESNEKCDKLYYMLPSTIPSMVLGRFLYLISAMIIVWIINGVAMVYLYRVNVIGALDVGITLLSGVIASVVCFCQYPIYYKFGMEKGKILSMLIYLVPAMFIFVLPSALKENNILTLESLDKTVSFIMNNKIVLPLLSLVIISIVGIISYLFSWTICKKKEV